MVHEANVLNPFERLKFPPVIVQAEREPMITDEGCGRVAAGYQVPHTREGAEPRVARPAVPDHLRTPARGGEPPPVVDGRGRREVAVDRDDGQVVTRKRF